MKVNELMIGDWVKIGNRIAQITKLKKVSNEQQFFSVGYYHTEDKTEEGFFIDDIQPIPITAEILEKNGLKPFKIDKLTEQATAKWWAKGGDYYVKQYNFKHNDFQPTYSFGCHPHTLIERLRYVHELQHALRLCGIDKEIVL